MPKLFRTTQSLPWPRRQPELPHILFRLHTTLSTFPPLAHRRVLYTRPYLSSVALLTRHRTTTKTDKPDAMPGEDSGIGAAPRGGASSSTNMQSPQRPNRRGGGVNSSDSTYSGRGGSQGRSNRGRGGTTGSGRGIGQGHNSGRGVDAEHGQGPATNEGGQRKRGGRGRHSGGSGGKGEQVGNGTLEAASMAKGVDPARLPTRRDALLRPPADRSGGSGGEDGADDDAEVCFICANPVIHHSITPCNHLTCHICALRMRALYRNKDCPHCRVCTPPPHSSAWRISKGTR